MTSDLLVTIRQSGVASLLPRHLLPPDADISPRPVLFVTHVEKGLVSVVALFVATRNGSSFGLIHRLAVLLLSVAWSKALTMPCFGACHQSALSLNFLTMSVSHPALTIERHSLLRFPSRFATLATLAGFLHAAGRRLGRHLA